MFNFYRVIKGCFLGISNVLHFSMIQEKKHDQLRLIYTTKSKDIDILVCQFKINLITNDISV